MCYIIQEKGGCLHRLAGKKLPRGAPGEHLLRSVYSSRPRTWSLVLWFRRLILFNMINKRDELCHQNQSTAIEIQRQVVKMDIWPLMAQAVT